MPYIEGFVAAVPTADREKYIEHARGAVDYFKKLGATRVVDGAGAASILHRELSEQGPR